MRMRMDVKICGLKSAAAMKSALDNGASHVGLIFFERSPRNVTLASASRLREAARGRARVVAVTVDATDAVLDEIVGKVRPNMLQLHGSETPARVAEIRSRYGLPVIKALPIRDRSDLDAIEAYRDVADRLLFDAKPPAGALLPGGRGESFDWMLLRDLDPDMDYMLSGGLHAGNVASAISIASPTGIDVSSGVEIAPGEKSPELISEFFAALAEAAGLLQKAGDRER